MNIVPLELPSETMNLLELKMVKHLVELKDKYHCTGVKMEFEAEGTRIEEAMRLKEISLRAGVDMTVKVGGCEAIKDMFEAASLGSSVIVAPMVETAYALKKYMSAVKVAFSPEQRENMKFLINLETKTACGNFDEMLAMGGTEDWGGIVLGRVDLTGSMGLDRDAINGKQVLDICLKAAAQAKKHDLAVVVGGGVSVHSIPFFQAFPKGHLDRFETRKVVFQSPGALANKEEAFLKAVEFELDWLRNKKNHYGAIHREDDARLVMMEDRYRKSIEAIRAKGK